jgi:hypothetical protein
MGCSAKVDPPPPPDPLPPRFATVPLELQVLETPMRALTSFDAGVEGLGVNGADHPVVVSAGRVFELLPEGPVARTLFTADGDPTRLGSVGTIAARHDGGAWLASENGVFVVDTRYVWRSGWTSNATQVVERASGPLGGIWVVGDRLVRYREDGGHQLTVPGLERVEALALTTDGARGFVTGRGALRLLSSSEEGIVAEAHVPELTLTNARSPVAGGAVLAALADEGLVVFDSRKTPSWRLLTGLQARALAVDPTSNALWIRTDTQLVVVDGELARATPIDVAQSPLKTLVLDGYGDVLMPVASGVLRLETGVDRRTVGFQTDIVPLVNRRCVACHSSYAQRSSFFAIAEDALSRVRSGDMPRCENGARCQQPLPATEAAVLESWVRGGKAP